MKVLWIANIPSPYRVDFYNELGKKIELTVLFERYFAKDRDKKWTHDSFRHFHAECINAFPLGVDKSISLKGVRYIKNNKYDLIVITGHSSPTVIAIIEYCQYKKIKYIMEYDGGFYQKDGIMKKMIKKHLLGKAAAHLTTCDMHIKYLKEIGISADSIYKYPFTSIRENEIIATPLSCDKKTELRQKLGLRGERVVISVGRFNYNDGEGKGFDLLFRIAELLSDIHFYIIGDDPSERYITWKNSKNLNNLSFIPFQIKSDLFEYYYAADLMVLLTRGDIWGLVINEAMACGLPVITTDCCIAGVEMIRDGINGYIVPANTYMEAMEHIRAFFENDTEKKQMSEQCIKTAHEYTVTRMAQRHMEIIELL